MAGSRLRERNDSCVAPCLRISFAFGRPHVEAFCLRPATVSTGSGEMIKPVSIFFGQAPIRGLWGMCRDQKKGMLKSHVLRC